MKQICVSCGRRRGTRYCPALGGYICSRCCGEKRLVSIACPPSCPHLKRNEAFQAAKGKEQFQEAWARVNSDLGSDKDMLSALFVVVAAIQQAEWDMPGLTDADVATGLAEVDGHLSPIALVERSDSPAGTAMWRIVSQLAADKNLTNDQLRAAVARVRRVYDAVVDPDSPRAFVRGLIGWLGVSAGPDKVQSSLIITPDKLR